MKWGSLKRAWNVLTTMVVVLVAALALLLVGARLLGLQVYTVLSGSMEPTYRVGSVIYVKPVEPEALKAGDVITFLLAEDTVATHRIVDVVPDEEDPTVLRFRTKGDANASADGALVHCNNVLGMPVVTIPWLGYAVHFIQHPPGTYVAAAFGALLVLLMFLPELFSEKKSPASPKKPRRGKWAGHSRRAAASDAPAQEENRGQNDFCERAMP